MDLESYLPNLRARDREMGEVRRARARRIDDRLPAIVRALVEEFSVTRVVLFGSLLSGELHERSDLDLAVAGLPPDQYWRALDTVSQKAGIAVDLIRLEEATGPLAERISREGRVLYG